MSTRNLAQHLALALSWAAGLSLAQVPPDAGQTLQQLAPPPIAPQESKPLLLQAPAAPSTVRPGGPAVTVQGFAYVGHTVLSTDELNRLLADAVGQAYDLAGLRTLAERIANRYRQLGYPFIRVFIPPQQLTDGVLRIDILEGRYSRVLANGEAALADAAPPFLSGLRTGDLIHNAALERTMLILDDQPGIGVTPTIRPGQQAGTGDLVVTVYRETDYEGALGLDNAGNRYTGYWRAKGTLFVNSPFVLGDRISVNGLTTTEGLTLGSVDYERPLGGSGLRAQIGYAHTSYVLGKEFANLDASGFARVWTARMSYPVLRSQMTNVTVSLGSQFKALEDRYGATSTVDGKSSKSWPLVAHFDRRDALGGGGISYGALTWTPGELSLDSAQATADALTARRQGSFHKLNLDASRIQRLPAGFSLYGRYSGQWTDRNLDSSERFSLGGAYAVRAYPMGEGVGDRGWLTQIELRGAYGPATPYLFYDAGQTDLNVYPWDDASRASRFLSGAGLGSRFELRRWTLDASLAWALSGGEPTADTSGHPPRFWLAAAYRF